ncbi:MAG TPA: pitrilysin family protein [Bacteroidia bacterium]|nr:pitrilysin family protein [Bacteroidia bacterium]
MDTILQTYSSGLKLIYQYSPAHVAHCGLMIGAGCREETTGKEGLAHFIEHVLFKGTLKRKAWQVLTRLESVGGELNAYTTREETCVHASFMNIHLERSVELIGDIVFNSIFPEKEIEKEKEVVLDEILSYLDSPMDQIYDDFECQVFKGHPLGNPILGSENSVKGFTRKDILAFVKKHYRSDNMVFSYLGSHSFQEVDSMVSNYLIRNSRKAIEPKKIVKRLQKISREKVILPLKQAHFITGCAAYSFRDKRRFPMFLLNNILGGPGMNSRLNMNIREKYGFTYNIESGYVPYRDAGIFTIYLATEQKHFDKTVTLVNAETRKLREVKISGIQLSRHKEQIKGQIAISQENRSGVMLNNAKSVLNYGQPVNIESVFKHLDNVTSSAIQDVANEILAPAALGSLLYYPG